MLTDFIVKKLQTAKYKILKDQSYFGLIPSIQGVWANAKTLEACRAELQEVLEDWLVLQLQDNQKVSGLEIKVFNSKSRQKQYA